MKLLDLKQIKTNFKINENDTGNCLMQISFLINKISKMQNHIQLYGKDIHTKTRLNNDALLKTKKMNILKKQNADLHDEFSLFVKTYMKSLK